MFSKRTEWKLTPNRFTQAQAELRSAGMKVLDLSVSNPARAGFHFDIDEILGSLAMPEAMDYDPQPKGLRKAREAVAHYYRDEHEGYDVDPDSLILTTSTSEAYSYIFRLLCNPGEEVLVPKPSYPLFEFLADLEGCKTGPVSLALRSRLANRLSFAVQSGQSSHPRRGNRSSKQSHGLIREAGRGREPESFLRRVWAGTCRRRGLPGLPA